MNVQDGNCATQGDVGLSPSDRVGKTNHSRPKTDCRSGDLLF